MPTPALLVPREHQAEVQPGDLLVKNEGRQHDTTMPDSSRP
jgi:hypothetical protein